MPPVRGANGRFLSTGKKPVKTTFNARLIKRKAQQGNFKSLGHAAGAIRLTARRSIRKSSSSSTPGTAPNTRHKQLKNALLYSVERTRERALIGPAYSVVGGSGAAHEYGGRYKKQIYPKRPFMGPALMKVKNRLPRFWAGSIS